MPGHIIYIKPTPTKKPIIASVFTIYNLLCLLLLHSEIIMLANPIKAMGAKINKTIYIIRINCINVTCLV